MNLKQIKGATNLIISIVKKTKLLFGIVNLIYKSTRGKSNADCNTQNHSCLILLSKF